MLLGGNGFFGLLDHSAASHLPAAGLLPEHSYLLLNAGGGGVGHGGCMRDKLEVGSLSVDVLLRPPSQGHRSGCCCTCGHCFGARSVSSRACAVQGGARV